MLGVICTFEGRSGLAARHIGRKVRIVVQYARTLQPPQHGHHQKITGTERTLQPVIVDKTGGKGIQSFADTRFHDGDALLVPAFLAFYETGNFPFEDRWLDGVMRGEHPCDGACPAVGVIRQKARVLFCNMKHN